MLFFGWRKQLKEVLDHIATINDELGQLQRDMAWLKWLARAIFIIALVDVLKDYWS